MLDVLQPHRSHYLYTLRTLHTDYTRYEKAEGAHTMLIFEETCPQVCDVCVVCGVVCGVYCGVVCIVVWCGEEWCSAMRWDMAMGVPSLTHSPTTPPHPTPCGLLPFAVDHRDDGRSLPESRCRHFVLDPRHLGGYRGRERDTVLVRTHVLSTYTRTACEGEICVGQIHTCVGHRS